MSKFKVGDRVKRVKYEHCGMEVGNEATVKVVRADGSVQLDAYTGFDNAAWHSDEFLCLVAKPGPVRTVTLPLHEGSGE